MNDMRNKRNVMWRACLDLQEMLDELMLKRAKIIGDRKKAGNGVRRLKRMRRHAKTSGTNGKKRSKHSTDG